MDQVCGGWGPTEAATEEIQKICDQVKAEVEKSTNKKYEVFRAVEYRSQIVAGTNFVIKVHVGGSSYLHLSVFQGLQCYGGGTRLNGVHDHGKDDPLVPF